MHLARTIKLWGIEHTMKSKSKNYQNIRFDVQTYILDYLRKREIHPYNRHLFTEIDFAPAFVTDRPNPENTTEVTDRPNHEYTTGSAVVSTLNAIPSEDKTPPLSPSLLTEELQTETTVQQQAINNSPVPTKEQENVDERQYTLSTPPRRCSSIINQETSPRPSTSVQAISKNPIVFTPEAVRPLPKAPPRKSNKGRKTRKSTIYTDTPEKEAIRKEHETRLERIKSKQVKKSLMEEKVEKYFKRKKSNTQQEMSSEEEECYCIVCLSPYSESRSGEKWIQCITCKQWAHEECTEGGLSYVCHNCDSN
ncbi:hypothetical protein JTB14_018925 [Gonioctena quinquepunctata]|nr:hypothetical protein JTB14_018925 [Gonioctena quinquepunctata]